MLSFPHRLLLFLLCWSCTLAAEWPKEFAFNNTQEVATNSRIVKKEFRKVNGNEVLFMIFEGKVQGISFCYYGYQHSHSSGITQFLR